MVNVESVHPPARSFQPRRRALASARAAAYERDAPRWQLSPTGEPLDLGALFGPGADVVLDIGFGGGEGLIEMAATRPFECIVGVEVHTPGSARVVEAIEANGWQHVRLVHGDALDFLPRVPLGSLRGVRIWFPDPWLKRKQQHRRIVRDDVVRRLVDRLAVGGTIHVATDIIGYATQAAGVLDAESRLRGGVVPRPEWRPVTRFEQRGLDEGRTPTDLIYERLS